MAKLPVIIAESTPRRSICSHHAKLDSVMLAILQQYAGEIPGGFRGFLMVLLPVRYL
jgi:hypothetical protein